MKYWRASQQLVLSLREESFVSVWGLLFQLRACFQAEQSIDSFLLTLHQKSRLTMAKIFSKAKRNCQYLQDKCYQKREPMNTRKKWTVLNYSWWIIDLCAPPYYTPGMCSNPAVIELAIWGFHSHLVFCEFISLSFLMQQVQDGAGKSLISIILNQRFLRNDQLCVLWMLSLLCILSISLMLNLQSIFIGLHTGKIHKAPHYLIKSMLNVIDEGCYNR